MNKNVYLVKRIDNIGYDQAISMVVVASDEEEALKFVSTQDWGDWSFKKSSLEVSLIPLTETSLITRSFNAA